MNDKLLLTKAIMLLYRESLIPDKNENSNDLVRTSLENIKTPDIVIGLNHDREIVNQLKKTVLEMCSNPTDYEYVKEDLLQTIKNNCAGDESLYETIDQGVNAQMSEPALKRSVVNLRRNFVNYFKEEAGMKVLNKAMWQYRNEREKIKSFSDWIRELSTQLEPFQVSSNKKDPAILEAVSIQDTAGMTEVFTSIQKEGSGEGIMRTGWQSVNDMLDGGYRPGEFCYHLALQHNWKTGYSLTLFKHFAQYNKPHLYDKTKKPLLVRISFEDKLSDNFQFLYKSLKENETGEVILMKDIKAIEPEVIAKYVQDQLSVNGWEVKLYYIDPTKWDYKQMCNLVIELEAEGYEIKVFMVDYLSKMPTVGCDQGPAGVDIRNQMERLKAFFAPRKIIFFTPHQLSTDAKARRRDGIQDFVKQLVGGGYTAGSKQLDQVYDVCTIGHIEKHNREGWYTIVLDKLRRVIQVEDKHRFCVLKFNTGKGVILDDLGKENSAYKRVGGAKVISQLESETFYDF